MTDAVLTESTARARDGHDLDESTARRCLDAMLDGDVPRDVIVDWLTAIADKGVAVDELVGAARSMRSHMVTIDHGLDGVMDTCGTGGSHSGTFNISTAAAIVIAAGGVKVAKHGNRRATSHSGSADVLSELGVAMHTDPAVLSERLRRDGIVFCFAPGLHPAMRHVVEARRAVGRKTLFNLLGPLCNPAGADRQLLGTSSAEDQTLIAEAARRLGFSRAAIVHAEDGQDEVSLSSPTTVIPIGYRDGVQTLAPESFGLEPIDPTSIRVADPRQSAALIRDVLGGKPGPSRETVVANAALGFVVAGRVDELRAGVDLASTVIDDGSAARTLHAMAAA